MDVSSPWQGRHGPLLIAEIGGNHEGDFDAAVRMTDLAIASGADVVKFQIYTGDTLVSPVESPDRHRHFQRFELSPQQHIALAERCQAAGRIYNASVWDLEAASSLLPPSWSTGTWGARGRLGALRNRRARRAVAPLVVATQPRVARTRSRSASSAATVTPRRFATSASIVAASMSPMR